MISIKIRSLLRSNCDHAVSLVIKPIWHFHQTKTRQRIGTLTSTMRSSTGKEKNKSGDVVHAETMDRKARQSSIFLSYSPMAANTCTHPTSLSRVYVLVLSPTPLPKTVAQGAEEPAIYSKEKCPVSDKFLLLENIFILHLSAKIRKEVYVFSHHNIYDEF